MKKPSKKKSHKKPSSSEILEAALGILKAIESKEIKQEVKEPEVIREPIDPEVYIAEMKDAVESFVGQSKNHGLIYLEDYFAIICTKVSLDVHLSNNANVMMPFETTKERTFCVLQIMGWSDSVKENDFIKNLVSLGARYDDVCLPADIRSKIL